MKILSRIQTIAAPAVDTLPWHEENIRNQERYINEKKKDLERLQKEVKEIEEDLKFYKKQLSEAKRLKKDKFDSDRFLKNKR